MLSTRMKLVRPLLLLTAISAAYSFNIVFLAAGGGPQEVVTSHVPEDCGECQTIPGTNNGQNDVYQVGILSTTDQSVDSTEEEPLEGIGLWLNKPGGTECSGWPDVSIRLKEYSGDDANLQMADLRGPPDRVGKYVSWRALERDELKEYDEERPEEEGRGFISDEVRGMTVIRPDGEDAVRQVNVPGEYQAALELLKGIAPSRSGSGELN